jgi:hypothetical protein
MKKVQKKTTPTRLVIQIVNANPKLYEMVRKLAEKEGRSISKQAERVLMEALEIK